MATKTVQAAEAMTGAVAQAVVKGPMFKKRLGNKQIFLPNFVITMIRNPKLPPTFASFIVPLNFNKLDLRDYLWNAYGVPVVGVRSYIQLQKLRQDKPGAIRISPRKWFRPRSIKKMTVEMERPFVWPEEPVGDALEKWDNTMYKAANKDRSETEKSFQPGHREEVPRKERAALKEQAKALLSGEVDWKPTPRLEQWEDVGEAREVETDLNLDTMEENDAQSPRQER